MSIFHTTEPFTEDDTALRGILEDAHLPSLLTALAQLTGDLSLLRDELRPEDTFMAQVPGGLPDEKRAPAIETALTALLAYRDGGCQPAPAPDDETLRRILSFIESSRCTLGVMTFTA